jgi:hypothetical protein
MGFSTKEEKIRSHNVRKLDVEQALFENEYPTAITGQEKSRDYQGPVYEVIGRNNGG